MRESSAVLAVYVCLPKTAIRMAGVSQVLWKDGICAPEFSWYNKATQNHLCAVKKLLYVEVAKNPCAVWGTSGPVVSLAICPLLHKRWPLADLSLRISPSQILSRGTEVSIVSALEADARSFSVRSAHAALAAPFDSVSYKPPCYSASPALLSGLPHRTPESAAHCHKGASCKGF